MRRERILNQIMFSAKDYLQPDLSIWTINVPDTELILS